MAPVSFIPVKSHDLTSILKSLMVLSLAWITAGLVSCDARDGVVQTENGQVIIAFYNVQNLFHPEDDPHTNDNDFTPEGSKGYTNEVYTDRISKIGDILTGIHSNINGQLMLAGLAEVENEQVLSDLCELGLPDGFRYIHSDSPDPRGIDVALLYNVHLFTPDTFIIAGIQEPYKPGRSVPRTRDILFVIGHTANEKLIISVNHWPSRRGGVLKTEHKRMHFASLHKKVTDSLRSVLQDHRFIIMGDLNDNPGDKSVKLIMENNNGSTVNKGQWVQNPFEELYYAGKGSYVYRNNWNMYDQILVSSELNVNKAGIYISRNNVYRNGPKEGHPKRSYEGDSYISGYSDHLPVYIIMDSTDHHDRKN